MGWPFWAILLVAAGAFILLNLLRNQEEMRRRRRPMQGTPRNTEGDPEKRRQPPVTDLDRFLQEVHRRRTATEGEEREDPAPRPAAPAVNPRRSADAPTLRASPIPGRRPPRSGQRPSSRRSVTAPVATEVIPLAIAVEAPRSAPTRSSVAFPDSQQPLPAARAVQSRGPSPVRRSSPLFALLNSRHGLRNAMILSEILGPPACKRHRR